MYQKPDPIVAKILNSDSFSIPLFNYSKTALIKRFGEDLPPISYVSRPQLKLGGLRFNPDNYTFISNFYFKKLIYFDLKQKKDQEIVFPKNSILRETLWSPDGKHLVVSLEKNLEQEIWLVQIPSLKKAKIKGISLNSVLSRTIEWVDERKLLIGIRTGKQSKPVSYLKEAPTGPIIQESGGKVSQNRTYPDLIKTPQDEKTFAQAVEQQLVIYDIKSKKKKSVGKPNFFGRVTLSPNSKCILIDTFMRPFSNTVPVGLFARKTEVWSLDGKVLHSFGVSGPFESLPIEGVPVGARSIQWIGSEPQSLFYATALDQGDWAVKADFRDELFKLPIPKKGRPKPESIILLKNRYAGFHYLNENDSFWIHDYERDRQWVTTMWVHKSTKDSESEIDRPNRYCVNNGSVPGDGYSLCTIFSVNESDSYADPGEPVVIRNELGNVVIAIDQSVPGEKAIFLRGTGAGPEGDRPFLRRFNLNTLESEEWFRSEKGSFERFMAFTNESYQEFFTAYESQQESPRLLIRKPKQTSSKLLYADKNPYEILSRLKKEVITYERNDGVKLSGILYYPLNYKAGEKYPAIIQAYPLEYTDASTAGQVRGSPDKFSVPYHEDMIYNALRGYFVLDETQMPIIGHPETKNDTFIEQLVASAKAAVDTLVSRGLVDEKRVGVVGHSYGAYMVSNLLTHSQLFAAGIAKSGAYNRTLTPFGFQGERRPLWKAKETYLKMSPFLAVDQLKTPILLIHGMADNNTGTFPMQSERYFDALKGQGAQARLVLLPEESHGYSSIESVGHVLYEVFSWFDRYLKA